MSLAPSNPYDVLFRDVFGRPVNAASELRSALPESVAAQVDWDVLEPVSCSLIAKDLRSRYSDLMFRTRLLHGGEAFIYLLMEHQSGNDDLMAFRMLEYVVAFWTGYLREHPTAKVLPPVLPVVVHSGGKAGGGWRAVAEVSDLIDLDGGSREALTSYLPRLQYVLDDVTGIDVKELRSRSLTPAALVGLWLLVWAPGHTELGEAMLPLVEEVRAVFDGPGGEALMHAMVTFMLVVGDTGEEGLVPVVDRLGPDVKEAIMTTAERLRAEGMTKGMTKGMAKGQATMLVSLLEAKFGALPGWVVSTVETADVEQMQLWGARVLDVANLGDVFAHQTDAHRPL